MNLNLTGHHVEITPAMHDYVVSKLARITRHFDNVIDVNSVTNARYKDVCIKAIKLLCDQPGTDQSKNVRGNGKQRQ